MTGTGTSSDPYIITTCDDWVLFWNTYGYETRSSEEDTLYGRLGNDLDFSDYDYSGCIQTSAMSSYIDFDGNGYAVKNISASFTTSVSGILYTSSFSRLYNLTFDSIYIIKNTTGNKGSFINATATSSAIFNIVIKNSTVITQGNFHVLSLIGSETFNLYNIALINNSISTTYSGVDGIALIYLQSNGTLTLRNSYLADNTITSLTTSSIIAFGVWANYYYSTTLLNFFERDEFVNFAGNVYSLSTNANNSSTNLNLVCCYSANTYTNCTGTIYPFKGTSYSSFFDKTLCEESGVTLDSTSEAADYGITTEELQSESFLRGKGWAI